MPESSDIDIGRPQAVAHRLKLRNVCSHHGNRHPDTKFIQSWLKRKLDKSLLPLRSELGCLKKEFLSARNTYLNRILDMEDKLQNIVSSSEKLTPSGSLASAREAQKNRTDWKQNSLMMPSCDYLFDSSDEADKTGFTRIRTRALLKAVQCNQYMSPEVTLGPNAAPNIWFPASTQGNTAAADSAVGLGGSADLDITPIPKAASSRKKELKAVRLIAPDSDEEESVNKEIYYQKRILADLNQLSLKEAQEKVFLKVKKWEEHDAKVEELLAQRRAEQQAEELARQQTRIAEMARVQEEYIKKQQELEAAQALRDREFYRRHEEKKKHQLEVEKLQREKVKRQSDLFQRIFENFSSFSKQYREILELFQRHEELKSSISFNLDVIKSCHEKFNFLIAKCKLDQIDEDDVRCSQQLLNEVIAFNSHASSEAGRIERAKKKEREEHLKRIEEEKLKKQREVEDKQRLQTSEDVVAQSVRYREYLELEKNHLKLEKEFAKDESLKKFRGDLLKAINIPLNAISAANAPHLHDKYKKLSSFIQNQTVIINDKRISAAHHPLGAQYAMDYLALKTVKQGEQSVSSNPEAAYPIAAVIVAIWTEVPEFGKLLLAHFYRSSPYLIPAYWKQENSESDEEYYTRLGFKYTNNELEEMDKFLKRQSGIMRLYCAIIVTQQNKANRHKRHPLPLSEAWKWLACFVSLPPKADISATLLLEMLEITGHLMMKTYPVQFRKLLHIICISYLPLVEKVTPEGRGGPVTRLRGFLEGLISGRSIPPPKGLLPTNFW